MQQAYVELSKSTRVPITNSTTGQQLYFALEGCYPGKQHYRYCTPHALKTRAHLLCPFCKDGTDEWTQHKRRCIPSSESAIMFMLARLQLDIHFCWQVMLGFWAAPVDFKCISHPIIIQADGCCHFKDMYDSSTCKHLHDDMHFCAEAVKAGYSVVRVHDLQVTKLYDTNFLAAAISAAANTHCIVLSPGYTSVCMYESGCFVTYASMLSAMLPGSSMIRDRYNNCVISIQ